MTLVDNTYRHCTACAATCYWSFHDLSWSAAWTLHSLLGWFFFWCSSPNICLHTYIVSTPIAHFRSWNLHLYNWCEDPEGIKDIKIQVQIREGINKNLMGYPPVTIILLYGEKKNANTACDLYFTTLRAQLTSQWLKVSCGRAKPLVFFLKSSAKPKLSTTGKWASMLKICEPSRISPATTLPNLFPNTAYNLPEIKNQC